METKLKKIFDSLKDYNLRSIEVEDDNQIYEELDDKYDLFHEITICLFNNYFKSISDKTNPIYLDSIKDDYLLDKNNNKIFITEFVELISEGDGEWVIEGQEDFLDY